MRKKSFGIVDTSKVGPSGWPSSNHAEGVSKFFDLHMDGIDNPAEREVITGYKDQLKENIFYAAKGLNTPLTERELTYRLLSTPVFAQKCLVHKGSEIPMSASVKTLLSKIEEMKIESTGIGRWMHGL